jgi:ubiquinone/menaquinone biosynthesis C-methylase UbiE
MAAHDIFLHINEQDTATLERVITRLEFRGKDPTFRSWLELYLDKLTLPANALVLVLGCGTGMEARTLASKPGFNGRIMGIDLSPKLVEVARDLTNQEGLEKCLEFQTGDAHQLDFEDGHFDAVIAHTLISHVSDPLSVLREACRVLKVKGQLAVFDGDYASWTFGFSDDEFAKTMDESLISTMVNNPRVMRNLPSLLLQAGLQLEETAAHLYSEIGKGNFFISAAETYGPHVSKSGLMPIEKVDNWIREQQLNHLSNTFFASGNYYTYLARKI